MSSAGPRSAGPASRLDSLPILPLRNSVLFPTSVVPINVGRSRSVRLVQELASKERALVGVVSQRRAETNDPSFADLHSIGTVARVVKVIRLGPSNYSVVLNGLARIRILEGTSLEPTMRARVERVDDVGARDPDIELLGTGLREATRELLSLMPNLPRETAGILDHVREPGALADLIAANFPPNQATVADKQRVLEAFDVRERVGIVLGMVRPQLDVLRVKREISSLVEEPMTRSQRDEVLRQQLSSIRQQLGESDEENEVEELRARLLRAELPDEAAEVARKQLARLQTMAPQSAEYNVARTYLEWIADLPWSKSSEDTFDVSGVRRCLEEDHFGLDKVKRRIVEYSAVRQLRADMKGPILLFVGPPGVGKTSLGRSIARAMGRSYQRIALGGVRDESEIRGHRRTYVGALPGRIIAALKRAGTRNPVLVLDEVDKLTVDVRGDPAAALLEVLDPEQNWSFRDHYLELSFDLSQVMFLATANQKSTIPPALMDRMELIEVPGYTRDEKLGIAWEFLVPKQLSAHGITEERLEFTKDGLGTVVDHYTREAGVRGLERQIAALCRAVAMKLADGEEVQVVVTPDTVEEILGPHKYRPEPLERTLKPGVATGLASAPEGGQIMMIEATKMPGKGRVVLTGNMRAVMQESAATAVSFVRSRAQELHLDPDWIKDIDLHLHIPHHGVPKDGPSAGLAMFAAVASLLLDAPLRADVALTGEISLRGRILPTDDLTPKLLAAHQAGIHRVLVPERNGHDLDKIPNELLRDMKITLVSTMDQVLPLVLEEPSPTSGRAAPPQPDGEPPAAVGESPG
jgi:ATP-dependent Lon protease